MYCVVKKYFKAIFKYFPFCHTAIITLFVIVIWVRLSQKHVTQNTRNSALQARDKACITLANKLSNGEVKVRQYLNRVIEIMGNYNLL